MQDFYTRVGRARNWFMVRNIEPDSLYLGRDEYLEYAFWSKWEKFAAKHKLGDDTPPDLELKPYEES